MRRLALIAAVMLGALAATVVWASSSEGAGHPYSIRAIFDSAANATSGEDVRIAGAPVGSIQSLDVTADKQAAVTLQITDARFTPFYANATCAIRPQSLIGDRYVDCSPGTSSSPPLQRIKRGPGAGTYYLPVTQTSSPIDQDIVNDIYQDPVREQLSIILDEFGTGLAARGSDLNAVIHRANPALGYTDQVLKILAAQNRQLAKLATDSDTVLAPLARAKQQLSDFIVQANTTSVASAARAADISRSFQLLPSFLRQLRPLMVDLGSLADQGTPLLASLGQSASALNRQFAELVPFAGAARNSLIDLGNSASESQPALLASEPLAQRLLRLGNAGVPSASALDKLLSNFEQTGGIKALMDLLFYGTTATNGFDQDGHYARLEVLNVSSCTPYATAPPSQNGCTSPSNFSFARQAAGSTSTSATHLLASTASSGQRLASQAASTANSGHSSDRTLSGLLHYLLGSQR